MAWSTDQTPAHHSEMRPMTNPPLLSPSPCSLLRILHLSRAPRRRNPTAGPPLPCTFRHRLLLLLPAAMSSASTNAPESVVADPTALARKVADIRAAGPAKLQADTPFVLSTLWLLGSLVCGILTRICHLLRSSPTSMARSRGTGTTAPAGRVRFRFCCRSFWRFYQ